MLVRLHVLLQSILTVRVQLGLSLPLLGRTQIEQEVGVLLTLGLHLLAKSRLLHAQVALLRAKRAEALGHVPANAELLRGQVANTLAKGLTKLRLLAQDVGLLARDVAVQTGKTCLLTCQVALQTGCALT